MTIMKAEQQDLPAILDLQYLAYQSEAKLFNNQNIPPLTQTLQDLQQEYEQGIILKAVDENNIIIGSVRAYSHNDTLYIGKLMVRPNLQGQGLGTRLLAELECKYPHKRYELFTSSKSERNIKLYKRLGYVVFKEEDTSAGLRFVYLQKSKDTGTVVVS
jgi:ribosomal protein S18 acetylase RimI-like enzyme